MKNVRVFLSENFQFLEVKFSIYLNRRVFVMIFCSTSKWRFTAQQTLLRSCRASQLTSDLFTILYLCVPGLAWAI